MGFFSKKSVSNNTSLTENFNTDARVAADGGSVVVRDGHVYITDGGAIEAAEATAHGAFDLAEGVAKLGADFTFDALGFVQQSNSDTLDLVERSRDDAFDFARTNTSDTLDLVERSRDDAFDFARANTSDTLDLIEATQTAAFGYAQAGHDASNALVTRTIEQQREESAQLGSQILRLGIPAVAILGLIFIMKGNG